MKMIRVLPLLIVASCLTGCIHSPRYVRVPDRVLARYKEEAVTAVNSPDVWGCFPEKSHAQNYTVDAAGIEYLFNYDRASTVTVRVPVEGRAASGRAFVAVVFNAAPDEFSGFQIVDIYEGR